MPSWVHKVSFSNFVAIARLVVLRGRIQGQQVRFPVSLIHYLNRLALCSHCELF